MQSLKKIVTNGLLISGLLSGLVMPVAAVAPVETRSLEDWLAILDDKYGPVNNVDDWEGVVEAAQAAVAEAEAAMDLDFVEADIDTLKYYADLENSNAQFYLGNAYYNGKGVRQDYQKAAEWYRKAADQEYAQAQFYLGDMYRDGKGVRQDYQKAIELYRKAAKKNHTPSQYNLGVAYNNGSGVTKNKAVAKEWFGKACDNGLQDGCDQYRKMNK